MRLTDELKGWLVEHTQVDETASDEEFGAAVTKAFMDDTLSAEELYRLTSGEAELAKTVVGAVTESVAPLAKQVAQLSDEVDRMKAAEPDDLKSQVAKLAAAVQTPAAPEEPDSKATAAKMFAPVETGGGNGAPPKVNVKTMDEFYGDTRKSLYYSKDGKHPALADQPVMFGVDHAAQFAPLAKNCVPLPPMQMESQSELDYAICGAYFKWAANAQNRSGVPLPRRYRMTDHDKDLIQFALCKRKWTGIVGRGSDDDIDESEGSQYVVHNRLLTDWQRKALLDDVTSGGLEAAPIEFDAAVITTPLLHGELFPLISVVPVTRGRRMEGFAITNPTIGKVAEGTSITPLTTDGMITAFDTTIYNATGAIEIGQDFESDSPVNIGQLVIQLYGEAYKKWLDEQIANGDGTTEPQGLFNASGITDIGEPAGGANAPPQPDDYLSLAFNVAKQYRPRADFARCVYVANDTSYYRARAIAVGASDERRVYGIDNVANYHLHEWPFKVQDDIANTLCGFFAMKYYRMYRRLGMTIRVETGGKELALKNLTLVVMRARWGGQLTLGGAGSYSDNWQT